MSTSRGLEEGDRKDDHSDLAQSGRNPLLSAGSDFQDGSRQLFSMYMEFGEKQDKKTAERWKADADVILIFTGLFSAAVAALITVTILDLKSNSQDTSASHFNNTQQPLTDQTTSYLSVHPEPSPSSSPTSAVWANMLLLLSLILNLYCALLATLLHQWARRYVGFTQQPETDPHEGARVRAFFFDGIDKCHVSRIVEALPTLLHISICFFFAGLLVWLSNIDRRVFLAMVFCAVLSAVTYLWFTLSPILRPNSPFYAPLSPAIWFLYTGILYMVLKVLSSPMFPTSRRFDGLKEEYHNRFSDGIGKTAEKTARKLSPEIDVRILTSTLDALGEDGARSRFFAAIPGFFDSNHVAALQDHLPEEFQSKFKSVLNGFLDRTFLSSSMSESARSEQLITCLTATRTVLGPDGVSQILRDILSGRWRGLLQSIEMAQSLWRWGNTTQCGSQFTHDIRTIVTQVVVAVRGRDNRWISLTKDQFGVPDRVLRDNIAHGDSALLSLLIHLTREAFHSGSWTPFVLNTLTQFDMCNTLPELQHEFCSLWNEIVREARRGGIDCTAVTILREIRHGYLGLHQGTDAFFVHTNFYNPVLAQPRSYRFCTIPSHRPDWIPTPQDPVGNNLNIPTPTRAIFGSSAASTTQAGDSPNPSPRLEVQALIISPKVNVVHTTTQQVEEANNISRFSSSADLAIMQSDHTPLLILPSTPGSVRITLPVTNQPVSEGVTTVKVCEATWDLNPFVPIRHPQHPSKSALSVDGTDTDSVQPEEPTPDLRSRDTGENPQASVDVSPLSPHPDPDPTITYPFASPVPPVLAPLLPLSIPDPHHVLDVSQCPTLATIPPDMAAPWMGSDMGEISSAANPMPQPIPSRGDTLQRRSEVTAIPATIFSDPQLSPITTPAIRSSEIPVELSSSIGPPCTLPNHTSHTISSPFESSTGICSQAFPWPSSVLYSPPMPRDGVLRAQDDTSGMERPIPMVVISDTSQSSTLEHDVGARTPQPDDTPHGQSRL